MARRSKQELLTEFHRLSDVFETAMDILCDLDPRVRAEREMLITRAAMLGAVEDGTATLSEVTRGVQAGLNDLTGHPRFGDPQQDPVGAELAARYHRKTGRSLLVDAGDPRKAVARILRRGQITDDDEARLIADRLAEPDAPGWSRTDRDRACSLMAAYETSAAP